MESLALGIQVLLSGLVTSSIYILVTLGILVVFQVSRKINFAYGQIGMVAAFGSWWFYSEAQLNLTLSIVIGILAAVILQLLVSNFVLEKLPKFPPSLDLISTLGVFLALTAFMQIVIDSKAHQYPQLGFSDQLHLFGFYVSIGDLITLSIGLLACVSVWYLMYRSNLGPNIRAVSIDQRLAESLGINSKRIKMLIWVFSGVLVSIAAILLASKTAVDAFYMTPVLIKAFIIAMIGGMNRILAPILVALLLGLVESLSSFFLGPNASIPVIFVLVLITLAAMPKKFSNENVEVRA